MLPLPADGQRPRRGSAAALAGDSDSESNYFHKGLHGLKA